MYNSSIRAAAIVAVLLAGSASAARAQTACSPDLTPPTITALAASPNVLWPPNHKFVLVTLTAGVTDSCDPAPACTINSVSSNEPVNGLGDGNTEPDWAITGPLTLNLRAERSGTGSGRVYTVAVNCRDAADNVSSGSTTVTVPHDQRDATSRADKPAGSAARTAPVMTDKVKAKDNPAKVRPRP